MLFENWFPRTLLVRPQGDPRAVARAVTTAFQEVDPAIPLGSVRTMDQVLGCALSLRKFLLLLLGIFGTVALVLASTGLYGLISSTVAARNREIGVRLAAGAAPAEIERLVLRGGLGLILLGLALGVGTSLLLALLLTSLVFGIDPANPLNLGLAAFTLLAVGTVASYIPARRAEFEAVIRLDPANYFALSQIGRLAALTGQQIDQGLAALRQVLTLKPHANAPGHDAAHWRLGTLHERQGDRTAARAAYQAALLVNPAFAKAKDSLRRLD